MTKVIIDSNIVFSALRGTDSLTLRRILQSGEQYFAPNFLISEIFMHKERILKKSKISEEKTYEAFIKVFNKITFVNEENISTANFITAFRFCKDVDKKDTPFVALSLELGYPLWTRDKELKTGLQQKGFTHFFDENAGEK